MPFFIAAILAFRSSRRLAISLSFSSLLILARLGAAAVGAGAVVAGSSSGISSHPDAAAAAVVAGTGAVGTDGFEGGLGEVTGVGLAELATELDVVVVVVVVGFGFGAEADPDPDPLVGAAGLI